MHTLLIIYFRKRLATPGSDLYKMTEEQWTHGLSHTTASMLLRGLGDVGSGQRASRPA